MNLSSKSRPRFQAIAALLVALLCFACGPVLAQGTFSHSYAGDADAGPATAGASIGGLTAIRNNAVTIATGRLTVPGNDIYATAAFVPGSGASGATEQEARVIIPADADDEAQLQILLRGTVSGLSPEIVWGYKFFCSVNYPAVPSYLFRSSPDFNNAPAVGGVMQTPTMTGNPVLPNGIAKLCVFKATGSNPTTLTAKVYTTFNAADLNDDSALGSPIFTYTVQDDFGTDGAQLQTTGGIYLSTRKEKGLAIPSITARWALSAPPLTLGAATLTGSPGSKTFAVSVSGGTPPYNYAYHRSPDTFSFTPILGNRVGTAATLPNADVQPLSIYRVVVSDNAGASITSRSFVITRDYPSASGLYTNADVLVLRMGDSTGAGAADIKPALVAAGMMGSKITELNFAVPGSKLEEAAYNFADTTPVATGIVTGGAGYDTLTRTQQWQVQIRDWRAAHPGGIVVVTSYWPINSINAQPSVTSSQVLGYYQTWLTWCRTFGLKVCLDLPMGSNPVTVSSNLQRIVELHSSLPALVDEANGVFAGDRFTITDIALSPSYLGDGLHYNTGSPGLTVQRDLHAAALLRGPLQGTASLVFRRAPNPQGARAGSRSSQ